jgi:hypothetical protein
MGRANEVLIGLVARGVLGLYCTSCSVLGERLKLYGLAG